MTTHIVTPITGVNGVIAASQPKVNSTLSEHFVTTNPLQPFVNSLVGGLFLFLSSWVQVESSYFNKKEHDLLRRRALTQSGIQGIIGATPSQREDVRIPMTSAPGQRQISVDNNRTDIFYELPITMVVWFSSVFIAFDPNRDSLMNQIPIGTSIPVLLTQLCAKVRYSNTFSTSYFPIFISNSLVALFPQLSGTFLDRDFVVSPPGFVLLLDFYQFLASHDSNYVKMTVVTDTNLGQVFPRRSSGQQVTFLAMNSIADPSGSNLRGTVCVHPDNSFPTAIKEVHFYDAFILGLQHYKDRALSILIPLDQECFTRDVPLISLDNVIRYIVNRVTGVILNSSDIDGDLFTPIPETPQDETPREQKPRQPKKGNQNSDNKPEHQNKPGKQSQPQKGAPSSPPLEKGSKQGKAFTPKQNGALSFINSHPKYKLLVRFFGYRLINSLFMDILQTIKNGPGLQF